jgi:2-haloacid dehalogenase
MTAGMQGAFLDRDGAPYNPLYRRPDLVEMTMGALAASVIAADSSADDAH